ncbi:MAG: hypothetical protein GXP62_09340 [Oligoflexia bacterium]|nr:hypothetical protein [Oligoflexia bacterium]
MGFLVVALNAAAAPAAPAAPAAAAPAKTWSFDDVPAGQLPAAWTVAGTNVKGPLASWQVVADPGAPSATQVLALTSSNGNAGGTFNLCWTNSVWFLDGRISVSFKAVSGKEDQGGGVIWRAQDSRNYLVARANPLEDNFVIYSVVDGVRRPLADASVALEAGQWHTLEIAQHGTHFQGYVDGQMLLDGTQDALPFAGGVGLWTKADAQTSFDDFSVRHD